MPGPISREFLRNLKATKQEEKRLRDVNDRVGEIYRRTIQAAELYADTSYRFPLTQRDARGEFSISDTFYRGNMKDILAGVKATFPDCMVQHINEGHSFEGILIDWS